jgi:hypothetical protein
VRSCNAVSLADGSRPAVINSREVCLRIFRYTTREFRVVNTLSICGQQTMEEPNMSERPTLPKATREQILSYVQCINRRSKTDHKKAFRTLEKWMDGNLEKLPTPAAGRGSSPARATDALSATGSSVFSVTGCLALCCKNNSCNSDCLAHCLAGH